MTNLEYINSLQCSQKLKDRIIELTKQNNALWGIDDSYFDDQPNVSLCSFFNWGDTKEGHQYWSDIAKSINNNIPIIE